MGKTWDLAETEGTGIDARFMRAAVPRGGTKTRGDGTQEYPKGRKLHSRDNTREKSMMFLQSRTKKADRCSTSSES